MKGIYKILVKGDLIVYTDYDDIPKVIDSVISFEPEYPESPHSDVDHKLIESFDRKLQELMKREPPWRQ
jgi:hypothetical protein